MRKPHPIWFSSREEIRIYVRHVISPFHPSFDRKKTRTTQWTQNSVLLLNGLCRFMYKLGWKALMTYLLKQNPYFSVTTDPNQMGFSPKCRYCFVTSYSISRLIYNFESHWCWKSDVIFYLTIGTWTTCSQQEAPMFNFSCTCWLLAAFFTSLRMYSSRHQLRGKLNYV